MKTLKEILTALFSVSADEKSTLTDKERDQVAEFIGVDVVDETEADVHLSATNKKLELAEQREGLLIVEVRDLKVDLATIKSESAKSRKTEAIEKALSEGKFPPKQREMYEDMFDKDPEATEKFLEAKGAEIDLGEHGNGHAPENLSDDDEAGYKVFAGLHPELTAEKAREEYIKFSGGDQ